jgi:hypothetical protein
MTDNELALYLDPVNQAHFETVKGEWQYGDYAAFRNKHGLVKEIQVNQSSDGRMYEIILLDQVGWIESQYCKWLPRAIDIENPERGLWGMVDWKQWRAYCPYRDGELKIVSDIKPIVCSGTPTAALLMALKEQVK